MRTSEADQNMCIACWAQHNYDGHLEPNVITFCLSEMLKSFQLLYILTRKSFSATTEWHRTKTADWRNAKFSTRFSFSLRNKSLAKATLGTFGPKGLKGIKFHSTTNCQYTVVISKIFCYVQCPVVSKWPMGEGVVLWTVPWKLMGGEGLGDVWPLPVGDVACTSIKSSSSKSLILSTACNPLLGFPLFKDLLQVEPSTIVDEEVAALADALVTQDFCHGLEILAVLTNSWHMNAMGAVSF